MLKALRHQGTKKKIFTVLAVAVILGFVVSLVIFSHDNPKFSQPLGTLDNRKISVQEYLDSYRAVSRQAEWIYGEKLNEMRRLINFKGEAWDRLLLIQEAKKENIRASDDEVVAWVTTQPAFKHNDRFDEKFYELYTQRALRTTPRAFEEEIRQMLSIEKLQKNLKDKISFTEEQVKEQYLKEKTEKSIQLAILPSEKFKDKGEQATEEAVKNLKAVKEKMTPENFETSLKAEGLEVTAVEKYTKGVYPAGIYPSENLAKAVAPLNEGQISDVFEVPKGAMIAKVTAMKPLDEKKFSEEKEEFKKQMLSDQWNKDITALLEKLRGGLSMNLPLLEEIFPSDSTKE